jgi:hypothetical protein
MRRLRLLVLFVASAGLIDCRGNSAEPAGGGGRGAGQTGAGQGGGQGGAGQTGGGRGQGGRGGGGAPAIPVKAGPVKIQEVTYKIQAVGSLEAEDMIR